MAVPAAENKVSPRFTNIPEYDLHPRSELVKAVHQFALAHMKKHLYIEHIAGGGTKGLSGDPVYKVISYPDHKFEMVVKVFRNQASRDKEWDGIKALQKIHEKKSLSQATPIEAIDRKEFQSTNEGIFSLLLQSAAQGDGLDDILRRHVSTNDPQRELAPIFTKVREAFKTIHETPTSQPEKDAVLQSTCRVMERIKEMLSKLEKEAPGLISENILKKICDKADRLTEEIKAKVEEKDFRCCIIHGDAQTGNVLVTSDGDVTLIDLPSLRESIKNASISELPMEEWIGSEVPERDFVHFYYRAWDVYLRSIYTVQENSNQEFDKAMGKETLPEGLIATAHALRSLLGTVCRLVLPENNRISRKDSFEGLVDQRIVRTLIQEIVRKADIEPSEYTPPALPMTVQRAPCKLPFKPSGKDAIFEVKNEASALTIDHAFTTTDGDLLFSTRKAAYLFSTAAKEIVWKKDIDNWRNAVVFPLPDKKIVYCDGQKTHLLEIQNGNESVKKENSALSIDSRFPPLIRENDFLVVAQENGAQLCSCDFELNSKWTIDLGEYLGEGNDFQFLELDQNGIVVFSEKQIIRLDVNSKTPKISDFYKAQDLIQLVVKSEKGLLVKDGSKCVAIDLEGQANKLFDFKKKLQGIAIPLAEISGFIAPMAPEYRDNGHFVHPVAIVSAEVDNKPRARFFDHPTHDMMVEKNGMVILTGPTRESWNVSKDYMEKGQYKIQRFDLDWKLKQETVLDQPAFSLVTIDKEGRVIYASDKCLHATTMKAVSSQKYSLSVVKANDKTPAMLRDTTWIVDRQKEQTCTIQCTETKRYLAKGDSGLCLQSEPEKYQINKNTITISKDCSLEANPLLEEELKKHYLAHFAVPLLLSPYAHTQSIDAIYKPLSIRQAGEQKKQRGQPENPACIENLNFTIERVFSDPSLQNKAERRILVSGPAGVGKSTLFQYLAHRWAKKKIWQEFTYVFWVKLRNLNESYCPKREGFEPEDYLLEYLAKECMGSADPDQIGANREYIRLTLERQQSGSPKKTLLLLDGYDECSPPPHLTGILENIKKYPNVIVSSRPMAVKDFTPDIELNVLGFDSDTVSKYVDNYSKNNAFSWEQKQTIRELQENPRTRELASTPLYLGIFCALIRENALKASNVSVTKLYSELTDWMHRKFLMRQGNSEKKLGIGSSQPQYNPKAEEDLEKMLKAIAFKAMQNDNFSLVGEARNTSEMSGDLGKLIQLGLLRIDPRQGDLVDLGFSHLMFQEFYAALELKRLYVEEKQEEAVKYITSKMFDPRHQTVLSVCAGLLTQEANGTVNEYLKCLYGPEEKFTYHTLHLFAKCLNECEALDKINLYGKFIKEICSFIKGNQLAGRVFDLIRYSFLMENGEIQDAILDNLKQPSKQKETMLLLSTLKKQKVPIAEEFFLKLCDLINKPHPSEAKDCGVTNPPDLVSFLTEIALSCQEISEEMAEKLIKTMGQEAFVPFLEDCLIRPEKTTFLTKLAKSNPEKFSKIFEKLVDIVKAGKKRCSAYTLTTTRTIINPVIERICPEDRAKLEKIAIILAEKAWVRAISEIDTLYKSLQERIPNYASEKFRELLENLEENRESLLGSLPLNFKENLEKSLHITTRRLPEEFKAENCEITLIPPSSAQKTPLSPKNNKRSYLKVFEYAISLKDIRKKSKLEANEIKQLSAIVLSAEHTGYVRYIAASILTSKCDSKAKSDALPLLINFVCDSSVCSEYRNRILNAIKNSFDKRSINESLKSVEKNESFVKEKQNPSIFSGKVTVFHDEELTQEQSAALGWGNQEMLGLRLNGMGNGVPIRPTLTYDIEQKKVCVSTTFVKAIDFGENIATGKAVLEPFKILLKFLEDKVDCRISQEYSVLLATASDNQPADYLYVPEEKAVYCMHTDYAHEFLDRRVS